MKFEISIDNETKTIILDRAELIYGATAVMLKDAAKYKEKEVLNKYTNEKMPVIEGNEDRFIIPAHNQDDYVLAKDANLKIKQVIAPYYFGEGEEKVREDKDTQIRYSVIAVIKDNKEDKYLCVDCKNRSCKSYVLGGIEKDETPSEAALREVKEETGYTNVKVNFVSNYQVINHFYAGYKNVNRYAYLNVVFGELIDDTNVGLSDEENEKHVVKWIEKDKLQDFININNNVFATQMILDGEMAYTEEGKMINCGELDGKDSIEVRKILEENSIK